MFFIFNLVLLPGLQLNKFYHKNYGIADRTVFVFDYEPSYFLEETEDSIILLISRSSLSSDIIDRGMALTGGGALLREIDTMLTRETGVPAYVADNPIACTALGAGKALAELPILQRSVPDM